MFANGDVTPMFCARCGHKNQDGASYCAACGKALTSDSRAGGSPSTVGATSAQVPTEQKVVSGSIGSSDQPHFAGFWMRFAANMVDSFAVIGLALVGAIAGACVGAVAGDIGGFAAVGYAVVMVLGSFLYFAVCESGPRQATFGKRALGLFVTDTRGRRVSFGRAVGRVFSKILNQLTLGIGWIMIGVTAKKRGLHDFVAGTLVVRSTRTAPLSKWVVVALCCAAAVPFTGIVAAIAVPGLLRARMSGNETSAIGSLRAINSAQRVYQQVCGGYATDLLALSRPSQFLAADLTTAETVTKSGYNITLMRHSKATAISNAPQGCEGAVSSYVATAVPVTIGSTGTRYFATVADGTVYYDTDERFSDPKPLR
jgi:uncharacterized RDD family membrane protein YckC